MKIRASLLVTVLMVGLMPVLAAEPASATTITARSMLFKLAVKTESGRPSYGTPLRAHGAWPTAFSYGVPWVLAVVATPIK